MSDLAPILQGFFRVKLMQHKDASPHTIASYRVLRTWLSEVSTRGWQVVCRQGWSWQ